MKKGFFTFASFTAAVLAWGTMAQASESILLQPEAMTVGANAQVAENAGQEKTADSAKTENENKESKAEEAKPSEVKAEEAKPSEAKALETLSPADVESRIQINGSIYASWWDGFHRSYYDLNAANINQTSISAVRELDTEKNGFDWGFCVDAIFGTEIAQCADDGFDGSWGVSGDGYGTSIFECYASLGYENMSLKVGKFETPLGIEPVKGVDRMFNSTSYMYDAEPWTHMGVLGNWEVSERFSLNSGVTMGADNSFGAKDNYGFLFGGSFDLTDRLTLSYEGMFNRVVNDECPKGNEYMHSIILGWDITERLNYSVITSYGSLNDKINDQTAGEDYGIVNYLTYELTDKTKLGLRYEWFEVKENPKTADEAKGKFQELAFSVRCDVTERLMIRPEVRYDWINEDGEKSDGFSGGIGGAIKF